MVTYGRQTLYKRSRNNIGACASNIVLIIVETEVTNPLAESKLWRGSCLQLIQLKFKGEMMKEQSLRILFALIAFAGLSAAINAQVPDQIVVNIPFAFVVEGKTLPAGTYKASRVSNDKWEGLVLSSVENRVGVIVRPTDVESAPADAATLTFESAGDQHFLRQIKTEDSVFSIKVPRQAALLASAPSHGGTTSGTANGSN